jgi:restriction system protein
MSNGLPWDGNSNFWEAAVQITAQRHRAAAAAVLASTTSLPETPPSALTRLPALSISSLIIPERNVPEGVLIRSVSALWYELVQRLCSDWSVAYQLTPRQFEELIAGVLRNDKEVKFDDVILTPGSGDYGRDVIAIKNGRHALKLIASVKRDTPPNLVEYDEILSLIGVLNSGELNASKGLITTTSDFPPRVKEHPSIKPLLPTRLQLMNGEELQQWLAEFAAASKP